MSKLPFLFFFFLFFHLLSFPLFPLLFSKTPPRSRRRLPPQPRGARRTPRPRARRPALARTAGGRPLVPLRGARGAQTRPRRRAPSSAPGGARSTAAAPGGARGVRPRPSVARGAGPRPPVTGVELGRGAAGRRRSPARSLRRRPMDAISKLSAAATSSQRPPRLLPTAAASRASSSSTRRRRASPQAGLPPPLGAAASTQLPPAVRLPSSPLGRAPAAAAHPRPGGRVGKREEKPCGATFWWLHLPSESPKRFHVQLRGWSCWASTPLAGLRPEPALKPLLEPCQRGPKS